MDLQNIFFLLDSAGLCYEKSAAICILSVIRITSCTVPKRVRLGSMQAVLQENCSFQQIWKLSGVEL